MSHAESHITPSSLVVWKGNPVSADVGGRVVLMSLERGMYYDIDEIGSDVWRRLATPIPVAQLCADLAAEYEGDLEVISADVQTLLVRLADQGLINVQSGARERSDDS
jgi:hypothetical protein